MAFNFDNVFADLCCKLVPGAVIWEVVHLQLVFDAWEDIYTKKI